MKAEFINPILSAVDEVLSAELGEVSWGATRLVRTACATEQLTAVVHVSGDLEGVVMCALPDVTTRAIVSRLLGRDFVTVNPLALSGIGELCNVIAGRAATRLEEQGFVCRLEAPRFFTGRGTPLGFRNRLSIPLRTPCGRLQVEFALERPRPRRRVA